MTNRLADLDLNQALLCLAQNADLRKSLEQTLGDYCHQSRNRLNSLKLGIYLAKKQASCGDETRWQYLEVNYQAVETQIDRLQMICRPMSLALVKIGLGLLFDDRYERWSALMRAAGHAIEFVRPDGPNLTRFDVDRLGMALDALVAWRAEQGTQGTLVQVKWWVHAGEARIIWSEQTANDSPREPAIGGNSPEWTLPILIRVVGEHGGRLKVAEHPHWHLTISWPTSLG